MNYTCNLSINRLPTLSSRPARQSRVIIGEPESMPITKRWPRSTSGWSFIQECLQSVLTNLLAAANRRNRRQFSEKTVSPPLEDRQQAAEVDLQYCRIATESGDGGIRSKVNAIPGRFRTLFRGEPEQDSGMARLVETLEGLARVAP